MVPGEADRLVLQRADLPGFSKSWHGGGQEKWAARYRRSGVTPVEIESRAEVAESGDGAEERLTELRIEIGERGEEWQPIGEPGLGDESFAFTRLRATADEYEVVWRDDNVTGHLKVEGELAFADVLALAVKQERRIDDAQG